MKERGRFPDAKPALHKRIGPKPGLSVLKIGATGNSLVGMSLGRRRRDWDTLHPYVFDT